MTAVYRLHGLNVSAPFRLGHPAPAGAPADIDITVGTPMTAADQGAMPAGRNVAGYTDDRPYYALVDRGGEGYFYRFHGLVDIDISEDLGAVRCRLVEGADAGMLPVIVAGNVMAALLLLRRECVLHASAIERDGRVVAMVGNSGTGKSTLAAVACMAGARLMTDDVLRVAPSGDGVVCYRGAADLRLRSGVEPVPDAVETDLRSADGRHLVTPEPAPSDRAGLGSIMVLRRGALDRPLGREVLPSRPALLALLGFPRVENWEDPTTSAAHFLVLSIVVDRIPVYVLDVPWGITGADRWPARLTDLLFGAGEAGGTV